VWKRWRAIRAAPFRPGAIDSCVVARMPRLGKNTSRRERPQVGRNNLVVPSATTLRAMRAAAYTSRSGRSFLFLATESSSFTLEGENTDAVWRRFPFRGATIVDNPDGATCHAFRHHRIAPVHDRSAKGEGRACSTPQRAAAATLSRCRPSVTAICLYGSAERTRSR
jgi:hypothetical protein